VCLRRALLTELTGLHVDLTRLTCDYL
jgi:hypothetical protein